MTGVVLEAMNRRDGGAYQASVVIKSQPIEYWLPTSPAGGKPERTLITLKAIATARRSWLARSSAPLLLVCYGLGRLEFDTFCALVVEILSTCDMRALAGAASSPAIEEICARHGVAADQGEFRAAGSPVPFVMLFDRESVARGY